MVVRALGLGGTGLPRKDPHVEEAIAIVRKRGAAPRQPGTRMLVLPDGKGVGTVGGGYAEALIISAALDMGAGEEQFRIVHIDLSSDTAEEEGMVCGGTLDVMLERTGA